MVRPYTFQHDISTFIYIYIYILCVREGSENYSLIIITLGERK